VDAIPLTTSAEAVDLFTKYKVYSRRELHSRQDIMLENYSKAVNIEALTASTMARTMIMSAAVSYQSELASAINAAETAGADSPQERSLLKELTETIGQFHEAVEKLDEAVAEQPNGDVLKHARYQRDVLLPVMDKLRLAGDQLESIVADKYWPLPKYREMLFMR
jgi:glutamine synthetase